MQRTRSTLVVLASGLLAGFTGAAGGEPVPAFPEIANYLVIATGEGKSGSNFAAFHMSDSEIGADQEILSTSSNGSPSQSTGSLPNGSSPNLYDVFKDRWINSDPNHAHDTVGKPDRLLGARPLFEGIDYSGNVALTGKYAYFESSNVDVYANLGIQCNRNPAGCFPNPSSRNSYFSAPGVSAKVLGSGGTRAGVSAFDPAALIAELTVLRDFIVDLETEFVMTSGFVNKNYKDSGSPAVTDLDAIDVNGDGIAVIDIDVNGSKFELNNTDWILKSTQGTKAIFRMADGTYYDFANSSIMLGDADPRSSDVIDELGAIFFQDAFKGTNELFKLNNVILGGIGLYDLVDFNPHRSVLLNPANSVFSQVTGAGTSIWFGDQTQANSGQNAQGCAQFISHEVQFSDNRWNRCSLRSVPEPGSLALLAFALVGLGYARRLRR